MLQFFIIIVFYCFSIFNGLKVLPKVLNWFVYFYSHQNSWLSSLLQSNVAWSWNHWYVTSLWFIKLSAWILVFNTAQKMKFSSKDFFNKCDQNRSLLPTWSQLLKKSLMEHLFFVQCNFFMHIFILIYIQLLIH